MASLEEKTNQIIVTVIISMLVWIVYTTNENSKESISLQGDIKVVVERMSNLDKRIQTFSKNTVKSSELRTLSDKMHTYHSNVSSKMVNLTERIISLEKK